MCQVHRTPAGPPGLLVWRSAVICSIRRLPRKVRFVVSMTTRGSRARRRPLGRPCFPRRRNVPDDSLSFRFVVSAWNRKGALVCHDPPCVRRERASRPCRRTRRRTRSPPYSSRPARSARAQLRPYQLGDERQRVMAHSFCQGQSTRPPAPAAEDGQEGDENDAGEDAREDGNLRMPERPKPPWPFPLPLRRRADTGGLPAHRTRAMRAIRGRAARAASDRHSVTRRASSRASSSS